LTAIGPNGEAMAIPSAVIGLLLKPNHTGSASLPPVTTFTNRRGWLGVALQPITVPDHLVGRAGQPSGRMVVSTTKGGPAEMAGMRAGDVLLSLNGASASGPQSLRTFLGAERVGTTVDVKLLRDGNVITTHLTIGGQPD
jgi:S1-C subfamily serine protease